MFTAQLVGNLTLASLNTSFYSPTLTTNIWPLGVPSSQSQQESYDFQSNVSLQVSRGQAHGFSMVPGLGIMYPSDRAGLQDDWQHAHKLESSHDMIYRSRTSTRTEAIYQPTDPGMLEASVLNPLASPSFLSPMDFSQEELDLVSTEPVIERKEAGITTAALEPTIEEQGKWVLQQILEASGHTVESLAAELAARFGDGAPTESFRDHPTELQSNSARFQNAFLRPRDSPPLGVNPADIMPAQPGSETLLPPPPKSPSLLFEDAGDQGTEARYFSNIKAAITAVISPNAPGIPAPLTEQNLRRFEEITQPRKKEGSDYEPSISLSASSKESAFLPSVSKRKMHIKLTGLNKRHNVKHTLASPYAINPQQVTKGSSRRVLSDMPTNYGTPVLDAHRGIELDELKAKAERYRLRNQCQEYDKKWLLSFAGKLTPEGQLMEEYRCYVIGCNQSNRRRDHILIHVGGHLDQRPFACTHCPARFLRKNECKRHELSHTGNRPFTCDMCPLGTTAFVRQDLLKRHQNRTHNLDGSRGRTIKRHRRL